MPLQRCFSTEAHDYIFWAGEKKKSILKLSFHHGNPVSLHHFSAISLTAHGLRHFTKALPWMHFYSCIKPGVPSCLGCWIFFGRLSLTSSWLHALRRFALQLQSAFISFPLALSWNLPTPICLRSQAGVTAEWIVWNWVRRLARRRQRLDGVQERLVGRLFVFEQKASEAG